MLVLQPSFCSPENRLEQISRIEYVIKMLLTRKRDSSFLF
jgi:hypothetical protein